MFVAGVYFDFFHHFAIEFTVFDKECHKHVKWFDLLMLAYYLLVAFE
jgi:hypothetical protein